MTNNSFEGDALYTPLISCLEQCYQSINYSQIPDDARQLDQGRQQQA